MIDIFWAKKLIFNRAVEYQSHRVLQLLLKKNKGPTEHCRKISFDQSRKNIFPFSRSFIRCGNNNLKRKRCKNIVVFLPSYSHIMHLNCFCLLHSLFYKEKIDGNILQN